MSSKSIHTSQKRATSMNHFADDAENLSSSTTLQLIGNLKKENLLRDRYHQEKKLNELKVSQMEYEMMELKRQMKIMIEKCKLQIHSMMEENTFLKKENHSLLQQKQPPPLPLPPTLVEQTQQSISSSVGSKGKGSKILTVPEALEEAAVIRSLSPIRQQKLYNYLQQLLLVSSTSEKGSDIISKNQKFTLEELQQPSPGVTVDHPTVVKEENILVTNSPNHEKTEIVGTPALSPVKSRNIGIKTPPSALSENKDMYISSATTPAQGASTDNNNNNISPFIIPEAIFSTLQNHDPSTSLGLSTNSPTRVLGAADPQLHNNEAVQVKPKNLEAHEEDFLDLKVRSMIQKIEEKLPKSSSTTPKSTSKLARSALKEKGQGSHLPQSALRSKLSAVKSGRKVDIFFPESVMSGQSDMLEMQGEEATLSKRLFENEQTESDSRVNHVMLDSNHYDAAIPSSSNPTTAKQDAGTSPFKDLRFTDADPLHDSRNQQLLLHYSNELELMKEKYSQTVINLTKATFQQKQHNTFLQEENQTLLQAVEEKHHLLQNYELSLAKTEQENQQLLQKIQQLEKVTQTIYQESCYYQSLNQQLEQEKTSLLTENQIFQEKLALLDQDQAEQEKAFQSTITQHQMTVQSLEEQLQMMKVKYSDLMIQSINNSMHYKEVIESVIHKDGMEEEDEESSDSLTDNDNESDRRDAIDLEALAVDGESSAIAKDMIIHEEYTPIEVADMSAANKEEGDFKQSSLLPVELEKDLNEAMLTISEENITEERNETIERLIVVATASQTDDLMISLLPEPETKEVVDNEVNTDSATTLIPSLHEKEEFENTILSLEENLTNLRNKFKKHSQKLKEKITILETQKELLEKENQEIEIRNTTNERLLMAYEESVMLNPTAVKEVIETVDEATSYEQEEGTVPIVEKAELNEEVEFVNEEEQNQQKAMSSDSLEFNTVLNMIQVPSYDETTGATLAISSHTFSLDIGTDTNDLPAVLLDNTSDDVSEAQLLDINPYQQQLEQLQQQYSVLKEKTKQRSSKAIEKIKSLFQEISHKSETINHHIDTIQELQTIVNGMKLENNSLKKEIHKLTNEIHSIHNQYGEQLHSLRLSQEKKNVEIHKLNTILEQERVQMKNVSLSIEQLGKQKEKFLSACASASNSARNSRTTSPTNMTSHQSQHHHHHQQQQLNAHHRRSPELGSVSEEMSFEIENELNRSVMSVHTKHSLNEEEEEEEEGGAKTQENHEDGVLLRKEALGIRQEITETVYVEVNKRITVINNTSITIEEAHQNTAISSFIPISGVNEQQITEPIETKESSDLANLNQQIASSASNLSQSEREEEQEEDVDRIKQENQLILSSNQEFQQQFQSIQQQLQQQIQLLQKENHCIIDYIQKRAIDHNKYLLQEQQAPEEHPNDDQNHPDNNKEASYLVDGSYQTCVQDYNNQIHSISLTLFERIKLLYNDIELKSDEIDEWKRKDQQSQQRIHSMEEKIQQLEATITQLNAKAEHHPHHQQQQHQQYNARSEETRVQDVHDHQHLQFLYYH